MTTPQPEATARTSIAVSDAPGDARVMLSATSVGGRPGVRPMLLDRAAGRARVSLVPDGALLLAGDHIQLAIEVGHGMHLEVVEPTGTVAYAMDGASARWDVDLRLGRGATLTWSGAPFVVSAGAHVHRRTSVRLEDGARLALREILVMGRFGEHAGRLDQRWRVADDAGPVIVEDLTWRPDTALPGLLGRHRVLESVVALGVDLVPEAAPTDRYDLEAGGTLWRRLAGEAHDAVLDDAWAAASAAVESLPWEGDPQVARATWACTSNSRPSAAAR